jgi:hypothetical protein
MATQIAYVANTNNLVLTGLKSDIEDAFLNSAVVTATVKDSTNAVVVGPVTMDYVAASDGEYIASLSASIEFTAGARYTAFIDADGSDTNNERIGHWEIAFTAKTRTS